VREEHRSRVFENRVVRRMFGPKREEVVGGWRRLHSDGVHNFLRFTTYYSGDQMKEDEIGEECRTHGRYEKCIHDLRRKT